MVKKVFSSYHIVARAEKTDMKEDRNSPFAPVKKVDHVGSAQRCFKSLS